MRTLTSKQIPDLIKMKNLLLKANILEIVKKHREDNPVYSLKLEELFNLSGSNVRDIVRELRREGFPIANSKSGYYYAESFEQIKGTVNDLEGRARSLIITANKLRKSFNIQPTLFEQI